MTVDGAASLQPNGLRGPEKCSRAFPLLRETGKFNQALSPKGIKRPKGPKRKLAVVPPYEREELFKRQPSVCAPATEGGSWFVRVLASLANKPSTQSYTISVG